MSCRAAIFLQSSTSQAVIMPNSFLRNSIRSLAQDGQGIHVTFERSPPRRFDLVIGADGLHSTVRRLAFGPEESFVRHAGLYVATLPLPRACHSGREMIMLNAPGKCVALHPSRELPLLFSFSGIRRFAALTISMASSTNTFSRRPLPMSRGRCRSSLRRFARLATSCT